MPGRKSLNENEIRDIVKNEIKVFELRVLF